MVNICARVLTNYIFVDFGSLPSVVYDFVSVVYQRAVGKVINNLFVKDGVIMVSLE